MVKAEDECMGSIAFGASEAIGAGFPTYSNNPQPVDPEKQRSFFEALVAEELSASLDKTLRLQLRGRIYYLLSIDNWDAVWLVATNVLQAQWVEFIGSAKSA